MTEALRAELSADSRSYAEVSRQTGVSRQSLMGFAAGERSLRLDLADKLAEFFNLKLSCGSTTSRNSSTECFSSHRDAGMPRITDTASGAVFSDDRKFRYLLWRRDGEVPLQEMAVFIGHNPSKADELKNDRTVEKCWKIAANDGNRGIVMLNLYALKSSCPDCVLLFENAVGQYTDATISQIAKRARRVICCWGDLKTASQRERALHVRAIALQAATKVYHLGLIGNKKQPIHPGARAEHRLPDDAKLQPWHSA